MTGFGFVDVSLVQYYQYDIISFFVVEELDCKVGKKSTTNAAFVRDAWKINK